MKLLLCCLTLAFLGMGCQKQKALLNGYCWKEIAPNETIIINHNGERIIGPGLIELWGKYPYIFVSDGPGKYFILNMNKHTLLSFDSKDKFSIALKKNSLPDFFPRVSSTTRVYSNSRSVNLYDLTDSQRDKTRSDQFEDELQEKEAQTILN